MLGNKLKILNHFFRRNDNIKGYLFILPVFLLFAVFILYPLIFSIILSFFEWKGFSNKPFEFFVYFDNYIRFVKDPVFSLVLKNTIVLVFIVIIFQNLLGLAFALFLFYGKIAGSSAYRAIIFFPVLLSEVAIGLAWRQIFIQDGLLNLILKAIKLDSLAIPWLSNSITPIIAISIVVIWQFSGFNMVIYYAAIQSLDKFQIESARIDGANIVQIIIKIVVPQLMRTISILLILNIIGTFKIFGIIFVMTGGGPAHYSDVLTTYMYSKSFSILGSNLMGYGSAIAVFLTGIVLIFAIMRIYFEKKFIND
ncbi:MAG: sugar ABC transporter permease [Actinomycetia bacterium]|nr:sugar ABC transporter permease [Actinomycetes bacterium]